MAETLYYLALGLFFTHELDAIKRHEWRMFPGTSRLDDRAGYITFALAHVPVFALILWLGDGQFLYSQQVRMGFSAFLMVHVGLHIAYEKHPANEFNNVFSQAVIWSAGGVGALYLALRLLA